jgi:hypothetical protein
MNRSASCSHQSAVPTAWDPRERAPDEGPNGRPQFRDYPSKTERLIPVFVLERVA